MKICPFKSLPTRPRCGNQPPLRWGHTEPICGTTDRPMWDLSSNIGLAIISITVRTPWSLKEVRQKSMGDRHVERSPGCSGGKLTIFMILSNDI